jgi:hypothetical protein
VSNLNYKPTDKQVNQESPFPLLGLLLQARANMANPEASKPPRQDEAVHKDAAGSAPPPPVN